MRATHGTHCVRLLDPEVGKHEVLFGWEVQPSTELYNRTSFSLQFPRTVDLDRIPPALWSRLAIACLYPHWALLAPCRVALPISLGRAECEVWLRLLDALAVNIAAYGGPSFPQRTVEFVECGPRMAPVALDLPSRRVAAAFSGGKDSLVQTALLAELTDRPLLVTMTSPVAWAHDHASAARRRVLDGIAERRTVESVEVESDFRSCWDNGFPGRDGNRFAVNELCDVLLYQATTLAVAAARGVPQAYLAAEAELQYNARFGGSVLQHAHTTSTAVTQAALSSIFGQFGLVIASLTCPLHMPEVMALLWRRYRDLADLQFSCWLAPDGAQACGQCGQCGQIALAILAEGHSPTIAGIDPVAALLQGDRHWPTNTPYGGPLLHETRTAQDKYVYWLRAAPPRAVASILTGDPAVAADPRLESALDTYTRLRTRRLRGANPPRPGYIAGYLDLIDPELREPLRDILDEHIEAAPSEDFAAMVARSRLLSDWITRPLRSAIPSCAAVA